MSPGTFEGFQLSPQQKRIWALQQHDDSSVYRAQATVRISGPINCVQLKEAIARVVQEHECLRTCFRLLPGMTIPLQVIDAASAFQFEEHSLLDVAPAQQPHALAELFDQVAQTSFDVAHGPVLHTTLVALSASEHVLIIALPALCADSAGLRNMAQAVAWSYAALCGHGRELDAPIQYADLTEWQNELLTTEDAQAVSDLWHPREIDELLNLGLPFEHPGAATPPFRPALIAIPLDWERLAGLEQLAQAHELAPPLVLLACWSILFWRLTGRSTLAISVLYDGRTYEELVEAVGPFARYLPLALRLDGDMTFGDYLARVGKAYRDVYEWQEYLSWTQVKPNNEQEQAPFFPLSFAYEEPAEPLTTPAFTLSWGQQYSWSDRFKLQLVCRRDDEQVTAAIAYDASLFQPREVERLAGFFQTLVAGVARRPDAALSEFRLLGEAEWRRVVVEYNDTQTAYPPDLCLHDLFIAQAMRTPELPAVVCSERELTYAELLSRARRLARELAAQGIGPETPVGIYAERSPELLAGVLAVLIAGGAYVPLDPNYPAARLTFLLEDAQIGIVLAQSALRERLPAQPARLIELEAVLASQEAAGSLAAPQVHPDQAAYIIYTSGSTGMPKGVVVTHRAACNRLLWGQGIYPLGETDRVLQSAASSFDFSVWELFAPLLAGACIVMPGAEADRDIANLVRLSAERQVTAAHFVPSLLRVVLEQPGLEACTSLRYVFSGGEVLPIELQRRFFARLDSTTLFNQYGPTEAAVDVTAWRCTSDDAGPSVPIGYPIANTQVYILDDQLQPLPIGVAGELYIGGVQLARGYLNRPDLTAERFVPNPFTQGGLEIRDWRLSGVQSPISNLQSPTSNRLYRTGDRAYWREDGALVYLGRVDHQVKIRGFRIELGEIEAALHRHPSVLQAQVVVREDVPGQRQLVAYIAPRDWRLEIRDSTPGNLQSPISNLQSELRAFLKTKLPAHMLPAAFVALPSLPLTATGKIDRVALSSPANMPSPTQRTFVAPRNEIEQVVADIYVEVLELQRVSVRDSFFDIGGHSLLATVLLARVQNVFRVEVPLRKLFDNPTVAGLSELLVQMEPTPGQAAAIARLRIQIDQLSPDEIKALLQQEKREST